MLMLFEKARLQGQLSYSSFQANCWPDASSMVLFPEADLTIGLC
jgi:hypothetical protein